MDYPNLVFYRGKFNEIYPKDRESESKLVIRDYLTGEAIGNFPDIKSVSKAIGGARNLHKYWNETKIDDRVEMLKQLGEEVAKRDVLDYEIARAGGFPVKYVRETRGKIRDYLNQSEYLIQRTPGKGSCAGALSVTAPIIQPWVAIETLLGGCSELMKGNSEEPFSAYLIADISSEIGLPVQFVTYETRPEKRKLTKDLLEMCDETGGYFVMMGDPITPKRMIYEGLVDLEKLDEKKILKLPNPDYMLAFTAHGGAVIVDGSAVIMKAVSGVVESFQFPRACKAPSVIYVHESKANEFIDCLTGCLKNQNIGNVCDEDTDVAEVSKDYWDRFVDPFLRVAKANGAILYGGEMNQPTIIGGRFDGSSTKEPLHPIYCIRSVKNLDEAIKEVNDTGAKMLSRRILDLSVYSEDSSVFERLDNLRNAFELNTYTIHQNAPTIDLDPCLGHEGVIIRRTLSEAPFAGRKTPVVRVGQSDIPTHGKVVIEV